MCPGTIPTGYGGQADGLRAEEHGEAWSHQVRPDGGGHKDGLGIVIKSRAQPTAHRDPGGERYDRDRPPGGEGENEIAVLRISCENMEAAFRDYMEWCMDWALHRIQKCAYITEEMAPQGPRNLAYDICLESWQSTAELRAIVRSMCEILPHGARPTWLWTERQNRVAVSPADDRAPRQRGEATRAELEELEADATRKRPVPD